jgi:unsaturated pyranuronate lyase
MPFIDTNELKTIERLPGWKGKYFDSESMTFGHYVFEAGSEIHEHFHPNEEVWNVIEGQLEVRIDGKPQVAGPGCVAIVPRDTKHFVKALTDGRAIVVDYPTRRDMSGGVAKP